MQEFLTRRKGTQQRHIVLKKTREGESQGQKTGKLTQNRTEYTESEQAFY